MDNKRRYGVKFFEFRTRELIKSITNFEEKDENFSRCLDFALENFIHHQYLDVDPFKVKKRISGFSEKFSIHSEDKKSQKLSDLATKYYDILLKSDAHTRETGYSVLALLTHLSGSCTDSQNVSQDENENDEESSEEISWSEHLREPEPSQTTSDTSSIWSESDDDSLESSAFLPDIHPPNTDSGIEVSPECNVPYVPPRPPFQPFKEPTDTRKRIPYWEPRYRVTKLELTSKNINTNLTKHWEDQCAKNCHIYTPNTNTVLPEPVVVRETLWMLHGLKHLYVFPWLDGHYTILEHIHMKHITEDTLKEILSTLCPYGEKVCAIMEFVNQVSIVNGAIKGHCQTYQAYGSALLFFIDEYRTVLTSYEKRVIDKELVTLMQLVQELKAEFDKLELLFDVHSKVLEQLPQNDHSWEHSMYLLDALWKQLVDYSIWTRSMSMLRILLFLFFTCLRPFMKMVEGAVVRGQFTDNDGEFFIQRNKEIGILDEKFWDRALKFRELPEDWKNHFLQPLFTNILLASKSMEMLRHLQYQSDFFSSSDSNPDFLFTQFLEEFQNQYKRHHCLNSQTDKLKPNMSHGTASEPSTSADTSAPTTSSHVSESSASHGAKGKKTLSDRLLYQQQQLEKIKNSCVDINKHWRLCQKIFDVIQPNSAILLHSLIERTLMTCIQNVCQFTNKELIRFLKEERDLVSYLSVMQKYYLMANGYAMFSFYSEVFDKMLDRGFRVDLDYLNYALTEAISWFDYETSQKLSLSIAEKTIETDKPLQQLAALGLSYDVGWPMNVILNKESQQKYCQLFKFLLQVKCTKYYLDRLYFSPLASDDGECPSRLDRWLSKNEPRNQKIHGMYIIRMRMLHFVNGFHNYIMSMSQRNSDAELNERLEKAQNLEDFVLNHQQYLSSLLSHCLFDPKLPYLREQILKMLSLVLAFQSLWLVGIDKVSMNDLKTIESEFSSCINLLKSYLSKPLRGKNVHLEDLANVVITESDIQHIFV